ncbi:MAG: hypothetical protein K0R30_867 [Ornithinibacter sp.]|nr:hypothetical protein [Ornithinibacter sp.]
MRHLNEPACAADEHPRPEGAQVERLEIDPAANRRICRIEHLEAAVEQEAVDLLGALAAADGVLRLDQHDRPAALREASGAAQSSEAGTHDDDVTVHSATLCAPPARRDFV